MKNKKANGHTAPTPTGLRLITLSGTFEAAREVTRITKIETASTYTQLANTLRALAMPKNIDTLKELFSALNRLNEQTITLGDTTLVRPSDHPLVTRLSPKEE